MSLSLLNSIILRSLVNSPYFTKGSEISFEEEDTNFIILADAIKELSEVEISGVEPYDPGTEYSDEDFVTYNNNTWQYINPVPQTGVTPGTDGSVWQIASQGLFSHRQNTDTLLAEGTSDEVSAADIRAFIDAGQAYVLKSGDTMSGHLNMDSNSISDIGSMEFDDEGIIVNETGSVQITLGELVLHLLSLGEITIEGNSGVNISTVSTANITADTKLELYSTGIVEILSLRTETQSDFVVNDSSNGVVLKSPNGHFWRLTVDNTGAISTTDLGTSL